MGTRSELITTHADISMVASAAKWTVHGKDADGNAATFDGIATHVFLSRPDGSLKLRLHTFN